MMIVHILYIMFLFNRIFSYLSRAFCIFILFLLTKEIVDIFSIYAVYIFLVCKQNVGAGINTLMSISDGKSPSIFCR